MDKVDLVVKRLYEAMEKSNLSYADLSTMTGIPKAVVHRYINGITKKIPLDRLEKISKALGVETSDILGWTVEKNMVKNHIIYEKYKPNKQIPVLGKISAGYPLYCEENIVAYTYTDLNGSDNEYFALVVSGNSMNAARICDGDTVIVRRQSGVENGQIAVVLVGDDEATIKRFYNNDDTVTLMPQSTDQTFMPQIYNLIKTRVSVLGLVVEVKIKI